MASYADHAEFRSELINWLLALDLDHFVTFNPNRVTTPARLKKDVARWFAMLDRAALGRNWSKKADDRAEGMGFLEHPHSNLHCHAMVRMPMGGKAVPLEMLEANWKSICPPGQLHIEVVRSAGAVANYVTKGLRDKKAQDAFFLASQWHRR